jgi:hypothetical protein
MARFKRTRRFARRAVGVARKGFRRARSSGGALGGVIQLDAMAYGAARAPIANRLIGYVPGNHPLKDEALMGVASWAAAKYGSGFIKQMGQKGLTVENARVGEYGGQMLLGGMLGGTTTANSQVYG